MNNIEILKNLDVLTNVHAIKMEIMINFEYKKSKLPNAFVSELPEIYCE